MQQAALAGTIRLSLDCCATSEPVSTAVVISTTMSSRKRFQLVGEAYPHLIKWQAGEMFVENWLPRRVCAGEYARSVLRMRFCTSPSGATSTISRRRSPRPDKFNVTKAWCLVRSRNNAGERRQVRQHAGGRADQFLRLLPLNLGLRLAQLDLLQRLRHQQGIHKSDSRAVWVPVRPRYAGWQ